MGKVCFLLFLSMIMKCIELVSPMFINSNKEKYTLLLGKKAYFAYEYNFFLNCTRLYYKSYVFSFSRIPSVLKQTLIQKIKQCGFHYSNSFSESCTHLIIESPFQGTFSLLLIISVATIKLMQSLLLGLWILKAEFLSDITISNKLFTLPKEDQYVSSFALINRYLPLSTELAYHIDVQPQAYRRHLFRYTYFYFATPSLYRDLIPLAGGTLLTSVFSLTINEYNRII